MATFAKCEDAERCGKLWNAADGLTTAEAVKYITHGPEMEEALEEIMASRVITGMSASIRGESRRRHMLPDIPSPSSKKKDIPLTAQSNLIPFIKTLLAKLNKEGA